MKIMRALTIFAFAIVSWLSLSALKTGTVPYQEIQATDSLMDDRAKYVALVRAAIKGREKKPADSVFKNIQTFKGMPAGRLLAIMDMGYSQSLGVSCGHCHNTNKWESEEKPQKQIARDMSVMVGQMKELLNGIKGLKSENPMINCTTCHRGVIKPALDLGK